MQPYQEAAEEIARQGRKPVQTAATLATGAFSFGAGSLASKVVPFLSKYISPDMTSKGLSKLNPRLGDFIKNAMGAGHSIDEIKGFISEKLGVDEKPKEAAADQRNVIEQYSPELFQFLKDEIGKGRQPLEAGALAQLQDRFKSVIKKLEGDHKTPFSSILQSLFGGEKQQRSAQAQQISPTSQGMQEQQPQQMGPGAQALLQALGQLKQLRGGK